MNTAACCTPLAAPALGLADAAALERVLRALADRHRLRLVNMLLATDRESICVCELTGPLGLSQPTVSHHLKQLVEAGLLRREKRGTNAHYALVPGALAGVGALLAEPAPAAA